MKTALDLVFIPFHDWRKCEREGFRTRDAHLMQQFSQHPDIRRVLVINRPISLSEIAFYRRGWRVRHGHLIRQHGGLYLSQVGPKTYTLDIVVPEILRPLAMRRAWTRYIFGKPTIASAVKLAMRDLDIIDDYAMFLSAPLFTPLARALQPPILITDAQDNLLKHALYRDVPGIVEEYAYWKDNADLLYTNSPETATWLGRSDAVHISNGVDINVFDPKRKVEIPADLIGLKRPIIGYAGKMQEMFDVNLMEQVLSTFPDISFVFIGQLLDKAWMAQVWKYNNAHYLGDKPYKLLPSYLSTFDICIIPYAIQRQHGGDPIKFYEYLAMEKPTVTMRIGGVGAFAEYSQVCIADDDSTFITGLGQFIKMAQSGEIGTPQTLPYEHTWEAKASQIINDTLRVRTSKTMSKLNNVR